jgi:molecular chaperone GrpE
MSQENEKQPDQESTDAEGENLQPDSQDDSSEEVLVGEIIEEEAAESGEEATEESSGEDEVSSDKDSSAPPSIEELYSEALAKAEASHNDYLRSVADMQNLRKRTSRDIQQSRSFAIEGFARDLLPVADNMVRALTALTESDDPAIESMREGLKMVQKELDRAFDKHGVVKVATQNVQFDPHVHQAVVQMDAPDVEPGFVAQEMQTGYTLNDRLLRPAMVGVAKS